ncbi:hypothetical protein [Actinoallomurus rhizosphaericola]|uniref:hypothetical protein n=1 Tax=Actinoallomurus rhizosphaericola TaxID=2952536 RepID=UPI002091AB1B|nr:hypothetical protein [Actinoallomurus rhizosphaericola]MCO5994157.1 hypothetical protein [Actinoallomurus rhizosphaericola]
MALPTAAIAAAAVEVRLATPAVTARSVARAVVAHFPHYSHQAATIGLGILATVIIAAVIAAIRTNRRRR